MVKYCAWALMLGLTAGTAQAVDWVHIHLDPNAPTDAATQPTVDKPTFDQLQQQMKYQNFTQALIIANSLLDDSALTNRYDVLLLKAQCHLELKNAELAVGSYAAATKATKDALAVALAASCQELVKRSAQFTYTPKYLRVTDAPTLATVAPISPTPAAKPKPKSDAADFDLTFRLAAGSVKPIDIIDPDSRKTALAALYVDQLAIALPALKAAQKETAIPPILAAVTKLGILAQRELATTGATKETTPMIKTLLTQASHNMSEVLTADASQVTEIKKQANQTAPNTNATVTTANSNKPRQKVKNGLTGSDIATLQGIITLCTNIQAVCQNFAAIPGVDASLLNTTNTNAETLAKEATALLNSFP